MGKQLTKSADKRKPKHGLDASRPSASKKGQRDAATVSIYSYHNKQSPCRCWTADAGGPIVLVVRLDGVL